MEDHHMNRSEHQTNTVAELLQRVDRKCLEAFILEHVPMNIILDTFGPSAPSDDDGTIHADNDIVDDHITHSSSSSHLQMDTNNDDGIEENRSKNSSTVISRNNSNNNVNNVEPPPSEEEEVVPTVVTDAETLPTIPEEVAPTVLPPLPTVVVNDALSLPDVPPSSQPTISSKPIKRRTPCICGDPVERWKNDAVRLRCKCLIHAQCLADHLQAALGSAFSQVSASGIRCPYFHTCKSYIGADDAAKFHTFLTTTGLQRQTEEMGSIDSTANVATVTSQFGTSEVSKLFKFSTAATFASSDLIYCPSCNGMRV